MREELDLIREFLREEGRWLGGVVRWTLGWSGAVKAEISKLMYRQRGRYSASFVNVGMAVLFFVAIAFSGMVEDLLNRGDEGEGVGSGYLIAAEGTGAETLISDLPKGETTNYRVAEGDTVSSIGQRFGVSIDTIVWENGLKSVDAIKPNQLLRILPVTGIRHQVRRGENIYSIAKKYQVDAQNIIDYPFNAFTNDETFALAAGQELIIPDGIKPKEVIIDTQRYVARSVAPVPGVVGEGNFMWPTSGHISQRYYWYHPAVDIANSANPDILASQGGTVVTAGWNGGGYGNYAIVDHGNGYRTLYAHMLNNSIVVRPGQVVKQGQKLGVMGSTGRSTGTHLHFEIITANGKRDPLVLLK